MCVCVQGEGEVKGVRVCEKERKKKKQAIVSLVRF